MFWIVFLLDVTEVAESTLNLGVHKMKPRIVIINFFFFLVNSQLGLHD